MTSSNLFVAIMIAASMALLEWLISEAGCTPGSGVLMTVMVAFYVRYLKRERELLSEPELTQSPPASPAR